MTPADLANLSLAVHSASLFLSLPAAYAVFGDKFVVPSLGRADRVCAKLRGKLSKELQQGLSHLIGPDSVPATANIVFDADGQPAQISHSSPLIGESFQEALHRFLDSQSDDFCRYHSSMRQRRTMWRCWSNVRILAALWPLCALLGTASFGAFTYELISMPTQAWLWTIAGILVLPLALLLLHLPVLAVATNALESLEP